MHFSIYGEPKLVRAEILNVRAFHRRRAHHLLVCSFLSLFFFFLFLVSLAAVNGGGPFFFLCFFFNRRRRLPGASSFTLLLQVVFDRLHETAYQGCGLARTILGPKENIRSLTRDDLETYIKTHYTAPRMVVAGAGAIDHAQLVQLADGAFGNLPEAPQGGLVVPNDPATFVGSDVRVRMDDMPLAHIALSVESGSWLSEHAFPLMVMQQLLGTWDRTGGAGANQASKLTQTVAELELAHSVSAFNTCYKDTGLFGVYSVCEPHKVQDLMWYTLEAMVRLCHDVGDDEVHRAKGQLKANLMMALDGSANICEDIGRQMLTYGRRLTPAEVFLRIDNVDTAAVKAAANTFINDQDPAAAAVGPVHELPDYNWMRRRTYWLRY